MTDYPPRPMVSDDHLMRASRNNPGFGFERETEGRKASKRPASCAAARSALGATHTILQRDSLSAPASAGSIPKRAESWSAGAPPDGRTLDFDAIIDA